MDLGIRALWYDLPEARRDEYLDWLHGEYLPAVTQLPGRLWAAHYQTVGGGARMFESAGKGDILHRPDAAEVGAGTQFLLLIGAGSPHAFFAPTPGEEGLEQSARTRAMSALRQGERLAVFAEERRVNGPEVDRAVPGGTPGPAIQMGSFRTCSVADEFDLAAWYTRYRLPAMARMPGCIATRKLLSVAGWAKHSVMYEFVSIEAREEHFHKHESLALDDQVWTSRIVKYTIHAPGSPCIGRRIWPEVE